VIGDRELLSITLYFALCLRRLYSTLACLFLHESSDKTMLTQEGKIHLIHDNRTVLLNRMTHGARSGFDLSDGMDH